MIRSRLKSFRYAFQGIKGLLLTQANARIHLFLATLAIILGCVFSLAATEWCLLALAMSAVFAAEAFNTALERLTDLVSPGYHELAGKAKDVAAAAVLFSAMGAAAVGLILFLPRFWALLAGGN
ncbi:MAG: diacylglycerol kinase family protein [Phaeodactylibacter sp.]|nr:diacylglycerol kinase family protein [Phaeodactylibacter sp.]